MRFVEVIRNMADMAAKVFPYALAASLFLAIFAFFRPSAYDWMNMAAFHLGVAFLAALVLASREGVFAVFKRVNFVHVLRGLSRSERIKAGISAGLILLALFAGAGVTGTAMLAFAVAVVLYWHSLPCGRCILADTYTRDNRGYRGHICV